LKARDLLRNEVVQTVLLVAITIGGVFAFWFGLRLAFRTDFPLLAVASGSMEPVFYRGDMIVVQGGLSFAELNAAPKDAQSPGEIIVFYDPRYDTAPVYLPVAGTGTRLIVHRATSKVENDGTWYFQTWGDRNSSPDVWHGPETYDGKISERLVVGKVVGTAPWLGHIPLFMHEHYLIVSSIIILLFVLLIIVDFILPKKESKKNEEHEERTSNTA